ncbi:MAG: hypothetical protein PUD07_01920 [bacterium]|nr:hypothetical protein [bacterium]
MDEIIISLNDGTKINAMKNTTYYELSKKCKNADNIIGVLVNNKIASLNDKIVKNENVSFIDITNSLGNRIYVAGLKMAFECAVYKTFPQVKLSYAYSVPKGIIAYLNYDKLLLNEDIDLIRKKLKDIINQNLKFQKLIIKNSDAISYYEDVGNLVKACNIKNIVDPTVVLYQLDDLINYYYSEMPYSTGSLTKYDIKYLGKNMVVIIYPEENSSGNVPEYINYKGIIDSYVNSQKWLDIMKVPYIKDVNNEISNGKIADFIKSCELNFNIEINETAKEISKNSNIKCVLISGPSSSGKTTITKRLASYFKIYGLDPIVISIDDYYHERVDSPKDENGEYDFECLEATDINYLTNDIVKLFNGELITLPKFNFVTGTKELSSKKIQIKDNSIILFEGLHAINDKLLSFIPKEMKYKIYVSPFIPINIDQQNYISSSDLRLLRRIVRDFRTRGYDVGSTIKNATKVKRGEDKYIIPLIPTADKIINTSLSYEVGVLKVYIEPLLYSVPISSPYYGEARRFLSFLKQFYTISSEYIPKDSILREFIGGNEDD